MLAAVATLLCALPLGGGPGAAVLAVVLCIALSRSELDLEPRGRLESLLALPAVGLVAVGAGVLLQRAPWLGALVFVTGVSFSIWLRRFGPTAQRLGSLIALPFIALLVTPNVLSSPDSRIPAALVPIVVSLLAVLWVSGLHALARRLRFLSRGGGRERPALAPTSPADGSPRARASSRMAVQMAVALAASFVIGYLYFPERWGWIVLTAFIVQSGNRGRLEVAYKSVLRLLGAALGTIVALSFHVGIGGNDRMTVALILGAVFLGVWLRPLGYAWWALFVTLALALLQGFAGASAADVLWPRLEEMLIGAVVGVASAWFVLPVRSEDVLRRRIASALAALADAFDPENPRRQADDFIAALAQVEQLAPVFRASRSLTRHLAAPQPAEWVEALVACRDAAIALIEARETPPAVRRAVGTARKAMRTPPDILPALQGLHAALVK
jgi:hypothetical protein